MNAVIKVGGKQYYVTEGSEIFVEKLNANVGDVVKFDQVLMLDSKIGSPYLTNVTVEGKVIKNGKQKKITVFKYKSKDRSNRKKQGHRQPYTKVEITAIKTPAAKTEKTAEKVEKAEATEKKTTTAKKTTTTKTATKKAETK